MLSPKSFNLWILIGHQVLCQAESLRVFNKRTHAIVIAIFAFLLYLTIWFCCGLFDLAVHSCFFVGNFLSFCLWPMLLYLLLLKEHLHILLMLVPTLCMSCIVFDASLLSGLLQLKWETKWLRFDISRAPNLVILPIFNILVHDN
jgi:hypothetical protein